MIDPPVVTARFSELDTATLYALLKLRVDVFVVEQECPYPELDGRDLEPETLHLWYVDDAGRRIPWARTLLDATVAGYGLEYQVFGHGHHSRQTEHGPPVPSTLPTKD